VRALPPDEGGQVPAVAVTAYARAGDRARALSAGYQVHLAQPVEPTALTRTIAGLAARKP
jgi:CheY-like chemotaxis protein